MGHKYRIIFIFILIFFFNNLNSKDNCLKLEEKFEICLFKKELKKDNLTIVIRYKDLNDNKEFEKKVNENLVYYRYYAGKNILLISDMDTIKPIGYHFEDNFGGNLNDFKQVIIFQKKNINKFKNLKIYINDFNTTLNIIK
jgi:hypothetical protein